MKTFCFLPLMIFASSVVAGNLPDPKLTPGDTVDVSTRVLCMPGYTRIVRNVTEKEKQTVYKEYGIKYYKGIGKDYEIDHFLSIELGGSEDIKNLWPEPYFTVPGAHEKDLVENFLHRQVCSGAMSLKEAQHEITTNWVDVYNKLYGKGDVK